MADEFLYTQADMDHVVNMHRGKIRRVERELTDARRMVGILIHMAGGKVAVPHHLIVRASDRSTVWKVDRHDSRCSHYQVDWVED